MNYFKSFPLTTYSFGKNEDPVAFQDISAYVDLIDNVKDQSSFYTYYTIKDGERPDHVSEKLYDTTQYHWTFFLLNDTLRLQGWPLDYTEARNKAEAIFPNTTLVTQEEIFEQLLVGQTVTGSISGATGVIERRNIDLGQLIITGVKTFKSGETITSGSESITIESFSEEYNATHHYEDSAGDKVDVSPFDVEPGIYTIKTNKEHYIDENEIVRDIRVFHPDVVRDVAMNFNRSLLRGI
jgi:hypothetical protein